jgi:hypothetical protein
VIYNDGRGPDLLGLRGRGSGTFAKRQRVQLSPGVALFVAGPVAQKKIAAGESRSGSPKEG